MSLLSPAVVDRASRHGLGRACNAEGAHEWAGAPLGEVIAHIVEHYQAALRQELPRLVSLAHQVEKTHADDPERPRGLGSHLSELLAVVESHMVKEQRILFPMILGGRASSALLPIKVLMQEHDDLFVCLRRTRTLTNEFTLPRRACATWRALAEGLTRLEVEVAKHVLLEDEVLFPRAVREAPEGR